MFLRRTGLSRWARGDGSVDAQETGRHLDLRTMRYVHLNDKDVRAQCKATVSAIRKLSGAGDRD